MAAGAPAGEGGAHGALAAPAIAAPPRKRREKAERLFEYIVLDKPNDCSSLTVDEYESFGKLASEWVACGDKTSVNLKSLQDDERGSLGCLWFHFSYEERLAFKKVETQGRMMLLQHRFQHHPPLLVRDPETRVWSLQACFSDRLAGKVAIDVYLMSGAIVGSVAVDQSCPCWQLRRSLLQREELSAVQKENVALVCARTGTPMPNGNATVRTWFSHLWHRVPRRQPVGVGNVALAAA